MKNCFRIIALVLSILTLPCCICGCWDKDELNELAVVLGVGIDKAKTPDEIEITAQMEKNSFSKSDSSSGGNKPQTSYINVTNTGGNVGAVMLDFTHELSRKIYIAQNQVIILGDSLARDGIRNDMDYFLRNYQARLTVDVFVAKGKAGDILTVSPTNGTIPSVEINKLDDVQTETSQSVRLTVADLMTDLMSSTKSMVAPYLDTVDNAGEKHIGINSSAVFKGDKVVGELNKTETRGYLWVINQVKSGKIAVNILNEQAVLQIKKAASKVVPSLHSDGSITIQVSITDEGILDNQTGSVSLGTPENIKLLETAQSDAIKNEIMQTLDKTRQMGTDIYGFGEIVKSRYPHDWLSLEPHWDVLYRNMDVQIAVTSKLRGEGRIVVPDYPEKELKK